jgi:hypothetical protein
MEGHIYIYITSYISISYLAYVDMYAARLTLSVILSALPLLVCCVGLCAATAVGICFVQYCALYGNCCFVQSVLC